MLFKHRNLAISASWFIMLTLGGVITDFVSDSLAYDEGNPPLGESRVATDGDKLGGHWYGYADIAVLYNPTGLRLKYGRLVVRNQTDLAYYRFGGKGPYFLEMEYDTLLKDGDYLFANRIQALVEIAKSRDAFTWLGPFFEIVRPDAAKLIRKRIGLLVYTEQGPQMAFFRRTHYFAQAGCNLEDPNRGGEAFFVIGFGGDFRI